MPEKAFLIKGLFLSSFCLHSPLTSPLIILYSSTNIFIFSYCFIWQINILKCFPFFNHLFLLSQKYLNLLFFFQSSSEHPVLFIGMQGDPTIPSLRKSVLNFHWKDWCWSWNFNTLATWCEELTHWKRPWCWKRLKNGEEGDDRGWDGWMASLTQWTWVWVSSGSWWWTGKPGTLQSMGSQRVWHDWATELNWNKLCCTTKVRHLRDLKRFPIL